ncbi:hypothetical protein LTR53_017964, partial [Teratosphaeriaceae sp. CCFEE 6253]
MGLQQLPDELLLTLMEQWPCRDQPLRQLGTLLSTDQKGTSNSTLLRLPSPSTVVVYGSHATGKSRITEAYLDAYMSQYAIINCRECITGRHLLERTAVAVRSAVRPEESSVGDVQSSGRCENIAALAAHLERLLKGVEKFVLVLDGMDRLREPSPTLLPALARLGEIIPALTTVLIVQHPSPRFLHQTGVPHIHFPPFTRAQSLQILAKQPLDIFLSMPPPDVPDYDDEVHQEDKGWLWPRYCAAIWDSLACNAARDLVSFREVCETLWLPFVAPIVKGDFGTRDFTRLLVAQRRLFQDESVLLDKLVTHPSIKTDVPEGTTAKNTTLFTTTNARELPYYAKWLLQAAYLASFNPVKTDALFFMKGTERKRRKKGGGTARSGGGRPSAQRKTPRHLLSPAAFTLDR